MNLNKSNPFGAAVTAAAIVTMLAVGSGEVSAQAQTAAQTRKTVVPESVPLDAAYSRWYAANRLDEPLRAPLTVSISPLPMLVVAPAPTTPSFEPQPVILGMPELPLIGPGVTASGSAWSNGFNYQGMSVSLVVVDSAGAAREFRPLSAPVRPGDRFKVRVVATFDGFAHVDQIGGDLWRPQRLGQLYPAAGSVVQMKAGETVDLPLARNEYFVMSAEPTQRLAVSVRDAASTLNTRSSQPLYRQDIAGASNFLQLVPKGSRASMEFLTTVGR